jgi:ABC-type Fe3+ transport system permease subunit
VKTGSKLNSLGLKALVALVLILILQPLLYLIIRASEKSGSQIIALLTREKTLEVLGITLSLLVLVVAVNVVSVLPLPGDCHYVKIPFPRFSLVATILPLAIPSYVFNLYLEGAISLNGRNFGLPLLSSRFQPCPT